MRPSLDDVNALPDMLAQNDFMFCIAAVPGGGTGKELWMKCQDVTLPGVSQKPVEAKLWGHTVRHRGAAEFTPTIQATFLEDTNFGTWRKLWNWFNYTVHLPSGNSVANKSGYTTTGVIIIHDTTGAPAAQVALFGLQITGIQDISLGMSNQGLVTVGAEFTFDQMALDYGSGAAGVLGYLLGGGSADALLQRLGRSAVDFFGGAALGAAQGWVSEVTGSSGFGSLVGNLGANAIGRLTRGFG